MTEIERRLEWGPVVGHAQSLQLNNEDGGNNEPYCYEVGWVHLGTGGNVPMDPMWCGVLHNEEVTDLFTLPATENTPVATVERARAAVRKYVLANLQLTDKGEARFGARKKAEKA
jgi:hypothetical protein